MNQQSTNPPAQHHMIIPFGQETRLQINGIEITFGQNRRGHWCLHARSGEGIDARYVGHAAGKIRERT